MASAGFIGGQDLRPLDRGSARPPREVGLRELGRSGGEGPPYGAPWGAHGGRWGDRHGDRPLILKLDFFLDRHGGFHELDFMGKHVNPVTRCRDFKWDWFNE